MIGKKRIKDITKTISLEKYLEFQILIASGILSDPTACSLDLKFIKTQIVDEILKINNVIVEE